MRSDLTAAQQAELAHLASFFDGHQIELVNPPPGPLAERAPGFVVARVSPGPRAENLWTLLSLGCWDSANDAGHGLEFAVMAALDDPRLMELLVMTAFYHAGPPAQRLDVGHTVPIGEPWMADSGCDHLLVSLPYPLGPDFERCDWDDGHTRFLWLLPISATEQACRSNHGLEALEQAFDDAALRFWDPARPSVV